MFIDYLKENNVSVLSVTENIDTMDEDDDLKDRVNPGHVRVIPVSPDLVPELRSLIEMHLEATGSPKAKKILEHFDETLPGFKTVISDEYSSFLKEA